MTLELDSLADLIRSWYPEARVSLDHRDSGASRLSVVYRDRLFGLESCPGEGVGVGEVRDDEGFTLGYDTVLDEQNSALAGAILTHLLGEATRDTNSQYRSGDTISQHRSADTNSHHRSAEMKAG